MIIAIASGKGGTGKTTLSAALARIWPEPVMAVDLDVEGPNLHLHLPHAVESRSEAQLTVPQAVPEKCNGCGACARLCQFHAIAVFGSFPTVFPEMCHGCGGCLAICTTGALVPATRPLGEIRQGRSEGIEVLTGDLRIGEALSPPLIRSVQERMRAALIADNRDVLIDAPPGASCPAMTAIRPADAVVLVAEATPFGLNDLKIAREAFAALGKPMGVVVNRAGIGDRRVHDYCAATGLPVLQEIPFDRRLGALDTPGETATFLAETYGDRLAELVSALRGLALSAGNGKVAAHA